MKFSEVIGQHDTKRQLLQMVTEGRVPHALLLSGQAGCGKMALAVAFASFLLGEIDETDSSQVEAANHLPPMSQQQRKRAEAMLTKFTHPDLLFSYPVIRPTGTPTEHKMTSDDFGKEWNTMICSGPYFNMDEWSSCMKAENQQAQIGVGECRLLISKLNLKSSQDGYKVCIIWLPERMKQEGANALLKLIEEPPQYTVFILVSQEPEKIIETIRSRTQPIEVKGIDRAVIERSLIEKRFIAEDTAHRLSRLANGSWKKALEELDAGNENRLFLDMFIMLMRLAYMRKIKELKKWCDAVYPYGREKQKRMLRYFVHLVRENFMYNFQNPDLVYMTAEEEEFAKNFARFINEANVVELTELFERVIRDITQNGNPKIVLFDMVLKVIVLLIQK